MHGSKKVDMLLVEGGGILRRLFKVVSSEQAGCVGCIAQ